VVGVVVVGLPLLIDDLAGSSTGGEGVEVGEVDLRDEPGMRTLTLDTYSPVIV